jgi:hypothetical protein
MGWKVFDRIPVGGENFRNSPDWSWGPPSLLYNGYRATFPRVKQPGRGVDHRPPSKAEVKESVVIPLLPLWAFVACSRVNLTLLIYPNVYATCFGFIEDVHRHVNTKTIKRVQSFVWVLY